jgi:hypothetical protein
MLYLYFLSAGPVVSCLNASSKLLSRSCVHELIVHNYTSEFRSISNYYLPHLQVQSTGREETRQVRREREPYRDELRQELKKMQLLEI